MWVRHGRYQVLWWKDLTPFLLPGTASVRARTLLGQISCFAIKLTYLAIDLWSLSTFLLNIVLFTFQSARRGKGRRRSPFSFRDTAQKSQHFHFHLSGYNLVTCWLVSWESGEVVLDERQWTQQKTGVLITKEYEITSRLCNDTQWKCNIKKK